MAAVPPPPAEPRSVGERCLLGWFSRADGIKHLVVEALDPRFDEQLAANAWEEYHRRVQELPEREAAAPTPLALTAEEQAARAAFMRRHHGAPNIRDVIKIDPYPCVAAAQLLIVTERAGMYSAATKSCAEKIRCCLGTDPQAPIPLAVTPAVGGARVPLPHAEFAFGLMPGNRWEIQQLARHISVGASGNRMLAARGEGLGKGVRDDSPRRRTHPSAGSCWPRRRPERGAEG
jgi:hypothetical protein